MEQRISRGTVVRDRAISPEDYLTSVVLHFQGLILAIAATLALLAATIGDNKGENSELSNLKARLGYRNQARISSIV